MTKIQSIIYEASERTLLRFGDFDRDYVIDIIEAFSANLLQAGAVFATPKIAAAFDFEMSAISQPCVHRTN